MSNVRTWPVRYALGPREIQLGILKRLRGTKIVRHAVEYSMIFDTAPPYSLQETSTVDAATLQRVSRFARYWDLIANSGRFRETLPLLLNERLPNGEGGGVSTELDGMGWDGIRISGISAFLGLAVATHRKNQWPVPGVAGGCPVRLSV